MKCDLRVTYLIVWAINNLVFFFFFFFFVFFFVVVFFQNSQRVFKLLYSPYKVITNLSFLGLNIDLLSKVYAET